jgi:tRNA 2-thiouridine synthesizing protein D
VVNLKKIAFVITTSPTSPYSYTAQNIVEAALKNAEIEVIGVFFYQDGVSHANTLISIPTDEHQTLAKWRELVNKFSVPLHLCISAAEKRGLTDEKEHCNIDACFNISGLGELVELSVNADRVFQL